MTPWQLTVCIEETAAKAKDDHDHDVWLMYHTAQLIRCEKMPDIKIFQAESLAERAKKDKNKKDVPAFNEGAIIAWLANSDQANKQKKGKKK